MRIAGGFLASAHLFVPMRLFLELESDNSFNGRGLSMPTVSQPGAGVSQLLTQACESPVGSLSWLTFAEALAGSLEGVSDVSLAG